MNAPRDKRPLWPYALAIPLALLALHGPVLAGLAVYYHDDLWSWFLPVHEALRRELWAGNRLPWSPLIGCGYPLAAEPQTGLWYPLNLLLAIPLPVGQMMGWLLWLHFAIGGLGMLWLARSLRLPAAGGVLAGLIFSTTGFMIAHLHHVAIITAAAWLPWAWWGLLAYRRRVRAHATAGFRAHALPLIAVGWCSAAQLLAGQPQVWLLTFVSGFATLLLAEGLLRDTDLELPAQGRLRDWGVLLAAAALGPGIAAINLLPAAGLYALSERSTPSMDFIQSYCLSRASLKTLLGVRMSGGDYWEFEAFAGFSTLALGFVALVFGKRRPAIYLLCAMTLFAVFMGLSQVNPLYRLAPHLPIISGMRCAGRWVLVLSVCLSLLAAYGLQALQPRRWLMWPVALIAAAEIMWFGAHYNPQAPPQSLQPPPQAALIRGGRLVSSLPYRLPEGVSHAEELRLGRQFMIPNANMLWSVPAADIYMPLQPRHFVQLKKQGQWVSPQVSKLGGVRWLLTDLEAKPDLAAWRTAAEDDRVRLWERTETAQAWLRPELADPDRLGGGDLEMVAPSVVEMDSRGVRAQCRTPRRGYLVLNVLWLPWWEGTVNGQAVQVQRSDSAFCAVPVPVGENSVELRYRQPRLAQGAALSALSLLLLIVLIWLQRPKMPFSSRTRI